MESRNKSSYIKKEKPDEGLQMPAEELPILAREYEKKHKIKLIVNGETLYGKQQIAIHDDNWQKLNDNLNQDSTKYASYLVNFWRKGPAEFRIAYLPKSKFLDQYESLKNEIEKFLINDYVKNNLQPDAMAELNNIIKSNEELKGLFDEQIQKYSQQLHKDQAEQCLDRNEVVNEISYIQKSLKENELVGYFYTNNNRVSGAHFDVLVISKNSVIRPVDWGLGPDKEIQEHNITGNFVNSHYDTFITKEQDTSKISEQKRLKPWDPRKPRAQASIIECGPLGLLYLKELLKDNGKQLKEFSLKFPYYDKDGKKHDFFFPPPQVLRYSQSGAYNKLISAMLEDSMDLITISHSDSIYTVTPIKKILESTRATALLNQHTEIAQACASLLNVLPEFRKKWQAEFHAATQKREMMQKDGLNRYLNYSSIRLHDKAMQSNEAYKEMVQKKIEQTQVEMTKLKEDKLISSSVTKKTENPIDFSEIYKQLWAMEENSFSDENRDNTRIVLISSSNIKSSVKAFEESQDINKLKSDVVEIFKYIKEKINNDQQFDEFFQKYNFKSITDRIISAAEESQYKITMTKM